MDDKQSENSSGGRNSDSEQEDDQEAEEFQVDNKIPMEDQFPMRNTYQFDNLTISSDFDAGNMRKWKEVFEEVDEANLNQEEKNTDEVVVQPKKFEIWISCDGLPYRTSGMRTWFYFYVKGANLGQKVIFVIKNMNRQAKLYNLGLRPVYRVIPNGKNWMRVPGPTSWGKGQYGLEIKFEHTFNSKDDQRVYFAFTYPFSYHDIQEKLNRIEKKLSDPEYDYIYYNRELLGYSIEKRNVDLVTLTSKEGISNEREETLEGWFPDHNEEDSKRPFKFENK